MPSPDSRLTSLDGLRGVAALIVVIHHYVLAFFPQIGAGKLAWIEDTPLAILHNGAFAVVVFFVLSGFVVSNAAARSTAPLHVDMLARCARLGVPAGLGVIWGWALLTLLPNEGMKLDHLLPHEWLHSTYAGDIPPFIYALYRAVTALLTGWSLFNGVLWTMQIELIGSLALYLTYAVPLRHFRLAALLVSLAAIPALGAPLYYEGFVLGALLREGWSSGRLPSLAPTWLFALGCFFGAQTLGYHARMGLPPMPPLLTLGMAESIFYPAAAALILYGVLMSPRLAALFSNGVARHLGRVSFPLYLVHVPLIFTVAIVAVLAIPLPLGLAAALLLIPFVGLCDGVAWIATRWGDEALVRFLGRAKRSAFLRTSRAGLRGADL